MDGIAIGILLFHGLIWGTVATVLVYLIVRRIRLKKLEDFENRDN